ncbi:MAG: tetratricopeptide repeat protein [Sandaracinaceae bacterium]
MLPNALACPSCGFDNPRAWRACARCGHPVGEARPATVRTLRGGSDQTVVDRAPSASTPIEPISGEALDLDPEQDLVSEEDLDTQSEGAPATEETEPPLVGQTDAAGAIQLGVTTAFAQGVATLVALEGDRGSGKTRLLVHAGELAARVAPNVQILYAACRASGADGTYAPFARLLLERFGVTPSSSPAMVRGQMATAVSSALGANDAIAVSETTHLLGHVAGIPFPDSPFLRKDQEPSALHQRAVRAWKTFLTGSARQRPMLLLLDNMHAADDQAFDLVAAALECDAPLAVVMAGAKPLVERVQALEAKGGVAVGPIAPLSEPEIAALVRFLLPTLVAAPEPLVAALAHRSHGNPSAIRELVFGLVEAGLFVRTAGGLTPDLAKLETGELPVNMEDAVRARLARLDAIERATLDRAAVMGEGFVDACLLAMMRAERPAPGDSTNPASMWPDDEDQQALQAALTRLAEKGFIETVEQSDVPGTVEFRFLHMDSRELLYAEQDEETRVARHRTVAHWISVVIEQHRAGMARLAAPHLERAGMAARAGRAYLEAAHAEQTRMHTQAALKFAMKALDLIDAGDVSRRLDALHLAGSVLTTVGRYDEARARFLEILHEAWRIGARSKGAAAFNRLARIHRQRGENDDAERLLEKALDLFRAASDLRGVASSLDDLAQVARLRGDLERASAAGQEALEIRRSHADVRGESVSLMTLGGIEFSRGNIQRAEELFEQAREIRESIGDRAGVMQVYNALGVIAFERAESERAEQCWRAALEEARQIADRHTQTFLLNNLGEMMTSVGRIEEAQQMLREARELAHGMKSRRAMAEIERNLGLALLKAGSDDAEKTLLRALALAEEYGSSEAIGLAHRAMGQLRAQTLFDDKGEPSRRAEECFLLSIDTFREVGNEREAARSLAELGFHLVERGDVESAIERLREARAIMRRIGMGQLARVEQTLVDLGAQLTAH